MTRSTTGDLEGGRNRLRSTLRRRRQPTRALTQRGGSNDRGSTPNHAHARDGVHRCRHRPLRPDRPWCRRVRAPDRPAGNNGTVKVDGLDLADGPGHTEAPNDADETEPDTDPHLSCGFQVEFFGFDAGQRADLILTAHPPTGDGVVVLERSDLVISHDAADGGPNDPDEVFDFQSSDRVIDGFTSAHDQHGWHIELTVAVFEADGVTPVPGSVKHKVLGLEDCEPSVPEILDERCPDGTPTTDVDADGVVGLADCDDVVVLPEATPATPLPTPPRRAAEAPMAPAAPAPVVEVIDVEVLGAAGAPVPVAPDTQVRGAQVVSELPRTGSSTTLLAVAGALLLLTGAALSTAGRHRAATLVTTR